MIIVQSIYSQVNVFELIADSFEFGYWYFIFVYLLIDALVIYLIFHKKINAFIEEYREYKESQNPYLPIWDDEGNLIGTQDKKTICMYNPQTQKFEWRYKRSGKLIPRSDKTEFPAGMKESPKVQEFKARVEAQLRARK